MAHFPLSAARSTLPSLRRSLATAVASSSTGAASTSAGSAPTSGPPGPSISTSWSPPIQPGVEPAYDEALKYLSERSASRRQEIEHLKRTRSGTLTAEEERSLKRRMESLEVAAEIDDPKTRWEFENGKSDMSRPVFRHLRAQAWRKHGAFDQLAERVRLMHVVPDVVPYLTPTVDLQLHFGKGAGIGDHGGQGGEVLVGAFVPVAKSLQPPTIHATSFDDGPEKLYTLLIVDPDSPDPAASTFKNYVHWLVTDLPLKATSSGIILGTGGASSGKELLNYVPPHPQQGTPYHRYTALLLEQPTGFPSQPAELTESIQRDHFSTADYIQSRGLTIAGIHFWRAVWSNENADAVQSIYQDILREPMPKFTHPPRINNYLDSTGVKPSRWVVDDETSEKWRNSGAL